MTPSVGLSLIVRDEEATLPGLLDSIVGAFDQIALVDTGSSDRTVDVFADWCRRTGQRHVIDTFAWVDDFAVARNHAQSLLETDWIVWADADDSIEGAAALRGITAEAERQGYAAVAFPYDLEVGPFNATVLRKRLVRRGAGRWSCPVAETQVIAGPIMVTTDVRWRHHGPGYDEADAVRNLRILRAWLEREPDNKLVAAALAAHAAGDESEYDAALLSVLDAAQQRFAAELGWPLPGPLDQPAPHTLTRAELDAARTQRRRQRTEDR